MQPSTNPNQEALRNQIAAMTAEFERQCGPVETAPITQHKPIDPKSFTITPPSIMAKRKRQELQQAVKKAPKTQSERSAKAAAKRESRAEVELRRRVRPGIKAMLTDLMQWNGIEEQAEAIQLLIMNAHTAGEAGSAEFLKVPRHEITISENVAQRLMQAGAKQAEAMSAEA